MNDGRSEWPPLCQTVHASRTDVLIARRQWESRDALMVSGFDLIGHNRTFQIHWIKRVLAYVIDLAAVFAPLWSFLYVQDIRAPWVYGIRSEERRVGKEWSARV